MASSVSSLVRLALITLSVLAPNTTISKSFLTNTCYFE